MASAAASKQRSGTSSTSLKKSAGAAMVGELVFSMADLERECLMRYEERRSAVDSGFGGAMRSECESP